MSIRVKTFIRDPEKHVLENLRQNMTLKRQGEAVDYPPPIVPKGGDFQYEFPAGNGVDNQNPPYSPGPPHWCTDEFLSTGHWDGVCPYVFKGPDAGKVRLQKTPILEYANVTTNFNLLHVLYIQSF